jgi:hypothetical protein
MKRICFLALCSVLLTSNSPVFGQSIVYDKSGLSGGPFADIYDIPFIRSLIYDPEVEGGWLTGTARASIVFGENEIKPYSLSYLIRQRTAVGGSDPGPLYTGGMLDPYSSPLVVEASVSLSSPILTRIEYEFEVFLRGVNISRDGAEGDEIEDYGRNLGHTTWSYKREVHQGGQIPIVLPIVVNHVNWQSFYGNRWGLWHSITSFSWSPAYSGANENWNQWSMPYGNQNWTLARYRSILNAEPRLIKPEGWEGSTESERFQLDHSVSDELGNAKDTYLLKVHDQSK